MSRDSSHAAGASSRTSSGQHVLVVNEMRLTVHNMYDMPRAMAQTKDPSRRYELVLKPAVKLYYHDQRVTHMDLLPRVIPFSPHDITCRNERFQIDFGAIAKARSGCTSPQRTSASAGLVNGGGGAGGSAGAGTSRSSMSDCHVANGMGEYGGGGDTPMNEIRIHYPSRADLKSIVEVSVGVRERHTHAASVRWLTTALEPGSKQTDIASFAAAEGEVVRHKIVSRFVGLVVGHLSCSFSLPYVTSDIRHVHVPADHGTVPQAFTDGLLMSTIDRLENDQRRLQFFYDPEHRVQTMSRAQIEAALVRGESEWTLYRRLLLEYDPAYFLKRVQKILDLYPPTPQHVSWVQRSAEELVELRAGDELQLIRDLSAELGPELNSISPRTRRLVFGWFYHSPPREKLLRCVQARYGDKINLDDFLDNEPDLYMDALCAHYGDELTPTRYYFPIIDYKEDTRPSFRRVLQRCTLAAIERGTSSVRTAGAAAAATMGSVATNTASTSHTGADAPFVPASALPQYLLELTPNERPLQMPGSGGKPASSSEIDILSYKYAEQFQFLTEPIAAAITEVIGQESPVHVDLQELPPEFKVFESETAQQPAHTKEMVRRCGMYTYISPSTLLATLIFLDRLCLRYPKLVLTAYNIRRLFTTMARIASKVVDLRSINNKNFARVFDLRLDDFNVMEDHLLKLMQFDFMLGPDEFNDYANLIRCAPMSARAVTLSSSLASPQANSSVGGTGTADSVLSETSSPVRADSVPASSRLFGGRRASASSAHAGGGVASSLNHPSMPFTSATTSSRRQPAGSSTTNVASSYDATVGPNPRPSASARPAVGSSVQCVPRRDAMMEEPKVSTHGPQTRANGREDPS